MQRAIKTVKEVAPDMYVMTDVAVPYTNLRAHETKAKLVSRLFLGKKKKTKNTK